jgi:hypothetical protein
MESSLSMAPMMAPEGQGSANGHLAGVDLQLARDHGGRPATWHAQRCGPLPVNQLCAAIVRVWRASGDLDGLAAWLAPSRLPLGCWSPPKDRPNYSQLRAGAIPGGRPGSRPGAAPGTDRGRGRIPRP